MRISNNWKSYQLLDAGGGYRYERWGGHVVARPDPTVIFGAKNRKIAVSAIYKRSNTGGGEWDRSLSEQVIEYGDLKFKVKPTNFKHMGLFPEQAVNWDFYREQISKVSKPVKILNLFAYTGGATLACAAAGAAVTHVDAAKGMVSWAKENAELSGLSNASIRWIVDDCEKFILREARRGNVYDGVIMDPPSYGRGSSGEVWKLEEQLGSLIESTRAILSDKPLFFAVNTYTTGVSHSAVEYILRTTLADKFSSFWGDEIGLSVESTGLALPAGATTFGVNE
jgi:Predicted SAM-dependent methyltransferases